MHRNFPSRDWDIFHADISLQVKRGWQKNATKTKTKTRIVRMEEAKKQELSHRKA